MLKQSKIKSTLIPHLLLDSSDIQQSKHIILAGDFNIFLDRTLESKRSSSCLKE